jgi:hypothetical protein
MHLTAGTAAAITAAAAFAGFFIFDHLYYSQHYSNGKCDHYDDIPVVHISPQ